MSYKCDECKNDIKGEPGVVISGTMKLGFIDTEGHFCTPVCFWNWIKPFILSSEELNKRRSG